MTHAFSTQDQDHAADLTELNLSDDKQPACQSGLPPDQTHAIKEAPERKPIQTAKHALLSSYFFASWGQRCWEFSIALFLIELNSNSLLYTAAYGFLEDVARLACGSVVGGFIDRTDRFKAASTLCTAQNMSLGASAAAAALALVSQHSVHRQALQPLLAGCCVVLGSVGSVGSLGVKASLEGDWPAALCGDDSQALTKLNSVLRGIDMVCLLLAPLVASLLMQFMGILPAVLFLLLWNLFSTFPEIYLMKVAYNKSPGLRNPKQPARVAYSSSDPNADHVSNPNFNLKYDPDFDLSYDHNSDLQTDANAIEARSKASFPSMLSEKMHTFFRSWHIYGQQRVMLAGLSLAVLYCTVLSLGYLMTAYIKSRGMGESQISGFRGLGAVTGLLATLVFPLLVPTIGLKACGLLGILWQLFWLYVGVVPALLSHLGLLPPGAQTPVLYVLLLGLAMSRFGLWLFDLAVAQLFQQDVVEDKLGSVNAIQSSTASGMELLMFCIAMAAPHPSEFPWLMTTSLAVVGTAAALYSVYCAQARNKGYMQLEMVQDCGSGYE